MTLSILAATKQHIDVAFAAVEFERVRLIAAKLKTLRGSCRCELAEADEPEVGYRGQPPCWKNYTDDGERETERDWCATCQRRQRLHLEYRKAAKVRGARMRSFQRIAQRGIDLSAIDKEVRQHMADEPNDIQNPVADQVSDDATGASAEDTPTEQTEEVGDKNEA